jgi:hypothetical protein
MRCRPSCLVTIRPASRSTSICFITPKRDRLGNWSTISPVNLDFPLRKSKICLRVESDSALKIGLRSSVDVIYGIRGVSLMLLQLLITVLTLAALALFWLFIQKLTYEEKPTSSGNYLEGRWGCGECSVTEDCVLKPSAHA